MSLAFVLLDFQCAGVTVDIDHGQWRVVAETLSVLCLWQTWAVYIRALILLNFLSPMFL